MGFNIVSSIISMLAPAVIDQVARAVGVNKGLARSALMAAVPAVLTAFGSKASTETGARALFDAVSKTDSGMLGDLAASLSGTQADSFLQGGLGALTSLLGDGGVNGLSSAIGRQAGLGGGAASAIVLLAGQIALGQLAKSVASDGLDAAGLGNLLHAQQANIKSALPVELGGLLSAVGSSAAD